MAAAKALGKNPRTLASAAAEALAGAPGIASCDVAGPGFINIRVTAELLEQCARVQAEDPGLGVRSAAPTRRIMLDYGGPNVAKALHVGHLRSAVIGESLKRILRAQGHDVRADVHLGDWGTPMGMLISELARACPDLPYFDPDRTSGYPEHSPVTSDDLARMYPAASAACKRDPARMEAARKATAELQAGRPGYRALWAHFRSVSVEQVRASFAELGVGFDIWGGESDADPLIGPLISRLTRQGLCRESDGAVVVDVARDDDASPMPPLLLAKADGGALYATTDLVTLAERVSGPEPAEEILYVVDQRQALHFEQVFRVARKAGLDGGALLEHVGFGTVNGPDGKPFKTRDGGVMPLSELLDAAVRKAAQRLEESGHGACLSPDERSGLARVIGIGALKFADLSSVRTSGYAFDADRLVSFEGRTGPYVQYAAVRIRSMLDKAAAAGVAPGPITIGTAAERDLALACQAFGPAVAAAARKRTPSDVAEYAFALAQAFSRFYAACPVLQEEDPSIRSSRLTLCRLAYDVLVRALYLLGIETPQRM